VKLAAALVFPIGAIQTIQMLAMTAGIGGALWLAWDASTRANKDNGSRLREFLPWALILLLIGLLAVRVFLLPMEMRGNALG
jgi:hypothetical protein